LNPLNPAGGVYENKGLQQKAQTRKVLLGATTQKGEQKDAKKAVRNAAKLTITLDSGNCR